ncbi:hypothetical protein HGRIS_000867 [Hohenbuehelia grisea]|uniref:Uncharacterized protein n=1 Tax=Hohenbuehelia grisea TaxID=104357 RepID=A0ABR3IQ03_9AGAR
MPPILRHGQVLNRRKSRYIAAHRLCTCFECADATSIDPASQTAVRGRYLAPAEYKAHRSLEIRSGVASRRLSNLSVPTFDVPPPAQEGPFTAAGGFSPERQPSVLPLKPDSKAQTSPLPNSAKQPLTPSNAKKEFIKQKLRDIRERFKVVSASDFAPSDADPPFVFQHRPQSDSTPLPSNSTSLLRDLSLHDDDPANIRLVQHEEWVSAVLPFLKFHQNSKLITIKYLAHLLYPHAKKELETIAEIKKAEWEKQRLRAARAGSSFFPTGRYMEWSFSRMEPALFLVYSLLAVLHLLCHVSMNQCAFVLKGLQLLLRLQHPETTALRDPPSIPKDIRTIIKKLDLDAETTAYACCPKCFCLYTLLSKGAPAAFPEICTYQATPGSDPCGRRLRKSTQEGASEKATRVFLYQDFRHWLARVYSRRDLEEGIDRSHAPHDHSQSPQVTMDIFDAPLLHELVGPDKRTLFCSPPGSDSHLFFSLNMDGFNPLSNKTAGRN